MATIEPLSIAGGSAPILPGGNRAQCKTCGCSIIWLKHERTGNPAPIEAATSDEGNLCVNLTQRTYTVVPKGERAAQKGWLHLNHFVKCPSAKFWHRVGRGAG